MRLFAEAWGAAMGYVNPAGQLPSMLRQHWVYCPSLEPDKHMWKEYIKRMFAVR